MKLQPITQIEETQARYPTKKASWFALYGNRVRRVGLAVAASAAFWVTGCFGTSTGGEVAIPNYFNCENESYQQEEIQYPGSFHGSLCSEGSAMGSLPVETTVNLRFSLTVWNDEIPDVEVDIIDPSGDVVATATNREPTEQTLSPGQWTVAVHSYSFDRSGYSLNIEVVE